MNKPLAHSATKKSGENMSEKFYPPVVVNKSPQEASGFRLRMILGSISIETSPLIYNKELDEYRYFSRSVHLDENGRITKITPWESFGAIHFWTPKPKPSLIKFLMHYLFWRWL